MTRDVRPPDLEMQVKTQSEQGRTRLSYTLHSPTGVVGFSHHVVAGPVFHGSPDKFHRHLLCKIDQLGDLLDVDGSCLLPEGVGRKLENFGRELWRELIPPELRSAYREIRRSVRSWMIVSDEPWIPWELIKPYDASGPGEILDDDFLALRFELTRWLAGESTPAREITVHSFAVLRMADLPQAKAEMRLLEDLARSSPGVAGEAPAFDSAGEVLSYLETCGVQILHFLGHGTHAPSHADESGIPLPDGSALRPRDLEGPVATRIRRNQPLVFLNTCWAGQQGWSLTGLGGWASRWVGVCGCGAFVAPLWPARDKAALAFAEAFYGAIARGDTLGHASLEARRHVLQARPGDPSALAYTVYGHPNARLGFGEEDRVAAAPASAPRATAAREPVVSFDPLRSVPGSTRGLGPSRQARRLWISTATGSLFLVLTVLGIGLFLDPASSLKPRDEVSTPSLQKMAVTALPRRGPPAQPERAAATEKRQEPKPAPGPAAPSLETTRSATDGPAASGSDPGKGTTFEVTVKPGVPKSTLTGSLRRAAAPLADLGISGWSLQVDVEAPSIMVHTQDGFPWQACRLLAHCRARRQGAYLDLGTVPAVNSQVDGTVACEAAAEALGEAVIYRFVTSVRKGAQ